MKVHVRGMFALFGAFAAGFMTHSCGGTFASSAEAKPAAESPYTAMTQLGRVLALVENEYVDPVDRTKLVNGAIMGMVGDLDPHSSYMPAQEYKEEVENIEGKFVGIGVEVELKEESILVLAPIEGSPADKKGLKRGDHIIMVDGHTVKEIGYEKLVRRMRGTPGTHVVLTVARPGRAEPLTMDIVRAEVHTASVRGAMMPSAIAYVQLRQFQSNTHSELLHVVGTLRGESKTPIAGVILDMRGNPGGLVDQASAVADEFLTSGTIYTMRRRGQIIEQASAHSGGAFADVPLVVLMSEWSASAAELVAGALQDLGRATVVGTRSFGKGSVQSVLDLPGGAGLKLTIARYYTPNGHSLQADGIHPDITVESTQKPDGGILDLREENRENALQNDNKTVSDAGITVTYEGDAGMNQEVAIDIPPDPRTGDDPVLRVGYETLLRKVAQSGNKR